MSLANVLTPAKRKAPVVTDDMRARVNEAMGKKQRVVLMTDKADALQRVEAGEVRRPAPTPSREPVANHAPTPAQNGTQTPAERAMRTADRAMSALQAQQYNILKHFVFFSKRYEQTLSGAVVAETALELARTGQF